MLKPRLANTPIAGKDGRSTATITAINLQDGEESEYGREQFCFELEAEGSVKQINFKVWMHILLNMNGDSRLREWINHHHRHHQSKSSSSSFYNHSRTPESAFRIKQNDHSWSSRICRWVGKEWDWDGNGDWHINQKVWQNKIVINKYMPKYRLINKDIYH